MAKNRKPLGEIFLEIGLVNQEQLENALFEQKSSRVKLGSILVNKGYVSEQQLMEALEFVLGVPQIQFARTQVDPEAVKLIPTNLCRTHKILPIAIRGNKLTLAMADPLNFQAIDDIGLLTGMEVVPVMTSEKEMDTAIRQYTALRMDSNTEKLIGELKQAEVQAAAANLESRSVEIEEDAPIIRMVNSILQQAVQGKASDIHIEPQETDVRVRFRIDGELVEIMNLPKKSFNAVASRVKITGSMDISEKRIPQDGRTRMYIDKKEIDFRISTLPTVHGEKIVMRILDRSSALVELENLLFSDENLEKVKSLIRRPNGMLLVTGPTGSGKTTTLYAILNRLNAVETNIITLEDPVEYSLAGISQVQINPRAGLTFVAGLRSVLRQDPDIVMVGEMRDYETAELGVKAALTGHLLLSTLHTNSAAGSIARLGDMGIQNYLLSSSLAGIIAQRLVRKLCGDCKEQYTLEESAARAIGIEELTGQKFYRNGGCQSCRNTGYQGRIPLHEVLVLGPEMRETINRGTVSEDQLEVVALNEGMISMKEDGLEKARKGLTSIEEVMKVVYLGG